ncbi:MAG: DUF3575 domain-containing protein [Alistipes sp.]|nr:DUF3575 domain-containing protein [Alistipes sp.]
MHPTTQIFDRIGRHESARTGFLLLVRLFQGEPCGRKESKQPGQILFYRSRGIERRSFQDDEFHATVARNDGCDRRSLYVFECEGGYAPDILSERDVVPSDSPSGDEKSEIRPESETPESSAEPDTPDTETPVEPEPQPAQPVAETLEGTLSDPVRPSYRWAVKTNVAYLAATVANLGVEYSFGDRYSVDLPVIYSPYTVARDYRLCFLAVQPEFRYWLKKPMEGHFFGVHLHIGAFNIAVDDRNRYQSPDGFYGAGLSYGYMLPFARHWAAEFTIGAGYVRTKYDVYYNIPNGARFEKGVPYNYWGLTKAGISLVYRFGK